MSRYIGLHIDQNFIRAAVFCQDVLYSIVDENGKRDFAGVNLLEKPDALKVVLQRVVKRAKEFLQEEIEQVVVGVPITMTITKWAAIDRVMREVGIKIVRVSYCSAYEALYRSTYIDIEEQQSILIVSNNHGKEVAVYENSEDVLEILSINCLHHLEKYFYKPWQENITHKLVANGILSNADRSQIMELVRQDDPKLKGLIKDDNLQLVEESDLHVEYGAALHAAMLEGNNKVNSSLLLNISGFSVGLRLLSDEFKILISEARTLPSKKYRKIRKEDLTEDAIILRIGELHRGYEEFALPLWDKIPEEFEVGIDTCAGNYDFKLYVKSNQNKELIYTWDDLPDYLIKSQKNEGQLSVMQLIDALDDVYRSISYAKKNKDQEFAKGLEMIEQKLQASLHAMGITEIKAVGQLFDPDLHYAKDHFQDPNLPEQMIVAEYKKGYRKGKQVIRCSEVVVVN